MKRSTLIIGAVAVAGLVTVGVLFLRKKAPAGTPARPAAPGPNGVAGFNASTISDILKNSNQILAGLGLYTKDSQSNFDGAPNTVSPAVVNDVPLANNWLSV